MTGLFPGSTTRQRSNSTVSKSSEVSGTCLAVDDEKDSKKPAVADSGKDLSNRRTSSTQTRHKWVRWILDILPLVLLFFSFILFPVLAEVFLHGKPSSPRMIAAVDEIVKYVSSKISGTF